MHAESTPMTISRAMPDSFAAHECAGTERCACSEPPAGKELLPFVFIERVPFAVAFAVGVAEGSAEPGVGASVFPEDFQGDGERDVGSFGVGGLPLVEPEGSVLPVGVGVVLAIPVTTSALARNP